MVTCLRQWVPKLKAAGFSEIVFEDALDMLIDQLNSLGQADSLTLETLESNMRDDTVQFSLSFPLSKFQCTRPASGSQK